MNARLWVMPLLVIGVAVAIWGLSPKPQPTGVPACTWRVGDDQHIPGQFAQLPANTEVRLGFSTDVPCHCYVASWSETDGTLALFPTPQLATDVHNPQPVGRTLLPGRRPGAAAGAPPIAWRTRSTLPGVTQWLVVASREPLPELEELFAHLRQFANTAFPDGSEVVSNPKAGDVQGKPHTPIAHELLQKAMTVVGENVQGPMTPCPGRPGVFVASWKSVTEATAK